MNQIVNYFSRKQKYTVDTQAVVGSNLVFLDVAAGFPGSIHDARMLRPTKLYKDAEANKYHFKQNNCCHKK